jgi:phage terminase large subunit-like protein
MSIFARLAETLADDWSAHARPEQLEPAGTWNIWLILSGRGWGKSRTGAEWVKSLIVSGKAKRVALVGATAADVRDVMIEGHLDYFRFAPIGIGRITNPASGASLSKMARLPRHIQPRKPID